MKNNYSRLLFAVVFIAVVALIIYSAHNAREVRLPANVKPGQTWASENPFDTAQYYVLKIQSGYVLYKHEGIETSVPVSSFLTDKKLIK